MKDSTRRKPQCATRAALCVIAFGLTVNLSCSRSQPQPTLRSASAAKTEKRAAHPDPALAAPLEVFFNLTNLEVPREKVLRGEMAKDDFKALVNPASVFSEEATDLNLDSRVVGITVNGVSKAYPFDVLTWHEVINDRVGDIDLAVTYCVLCDSVSVVDRRVDGKTYEFGVSGLIYESNMLLYDRSDRALWSQMGLSAISGPNAGRALESLVDWELTTWETWRSAHPKSRVVTPRCTGFNLPYQSDRYREYFQTEALDRRFQDVATDERLPNKASVIGVRTATTIRAYPIDVLMGDGRKVIRDKLGGDFVEFSVDPATRSIRIKRIPDKAQVISTFWFAWAARFPRTELYSKSNGFQPRLELDASGFGSVLSSLEPWKPNSTLEEIAARWRQVPRQSLEYFQKAFGGKDRAANDPRFRLTEATLLNFEDKAEDAYNLLARLRSQLEKDDGLARAYLYAVIYFQGVTALRRGENDNCVLCAGECSCILPFVPAAVHTNRTGSLLAIKHLTEYLDRFPDDLEVRWLLNVAHMTLGEHPAKVDPRWLVSLDSYNRSEFDIGQFRDIAGLVKVNRFNQAGGAIMDDFDDDGLLDLFVTSFDPTQPSCLYRSRGDGAFEDQSAKAGLSDQLGGLVCYQADFNNDGRLDIFIPRGAWLPAPIRPSLLRNDGDGKFSDVTVQAGLLYALNSNSACWGDYDNDGFVDLFVACERQPNRLFHNKGDGTFEDVAFKARVWGSHAFWCKGSTWIDYDNDDRPDLFLNHLLEGTAKLYHNEGNGKFADVTTALGIDGPMKGFSCWTWDYDNDGWLDIFATSYDRTCADVVKGLLGQPHGRHPNKLWHNEQGKRFEDMTRQAGLDLVFATMGSNFGDFDNDGLLDMYLGTGEPNLATLIPNRMFKNVDGKRFAEITATSRTGHLQKGHAVACGDWDRDGDTDIFIEMGGAADGDRYRNVLFQNPGQGNHWLTLKLVGTKTNRAAIGARIKVVTTGARPLTIYRHVSSGSSFGANPLRQTIGLGQAQRIAELTIRWPTSQTTQVFHDIEVNQAIQVVELADRYQKLEWTPLPLPQGR